MEERGMTPRGVDVSLVDPAIKWVRLAGHALWAAGALALIVALGSFVRAHVWLWSDAAHVRPGREPGSLPNPFHRLDDEHQWFVIGFCLIPILAGYAILSSAPRVRGRSLSR